MKNADVIPLKKSKRNNAGEQSHYPCQRATRAPLSREVNNADAVACERSDDPSGAAEHNISKADVWGMGANHSPKKSKHNNAGEQSHHPCQRATRAPLSRERAK